jgi:hypothetical protein
MVDDYLTKFYRSNSEEELKIKLLATMAVWKAKKGVYIITKMKKKFTLSLIILNGKIFYVKLNYGGKRRLKCKKV